MTRSELLTVTIEIEAIPPTINALSRKHWSWRVKQKNEWMIRIWAMGLHEKNKLRDWKKEGVRVRIEITVHHNREFDPDNLHSIGKIPLDSLKTLGFITDDKSKHIDFVAAQVKAKKAKTVIVISKV